jgi:predicted phage baseplate assembly protein
VPPATPAPIIDPRNFQDLVDEAKRLIPQYCPEWTDHNVSDPGVTLIELFAWMTDIILYRLNKVPERDFLKFLELIGARPKTAVPASTEMTFWLTAPQRETKLIPRGTVVATRQTETRQAVSFVTDSDLRIRVPLLSHWILARRTEKSAPDDYLYEDVSEQLKWGDATAQVFQETPREGDAFYLGFEENLAGHVIRLNLRCDELGGLNVNQDDPPLTWEFWNGEAWAPLLPSLDEVSVLRRSESECDELGRRLDNTRGLNLRQGRVLLVVPRTCALRELRFNTRAVEACWFRCRAARRRPEERFYERSPTVYGIRPESIAGMVVATHSSEVVAEVLGRSDGTPDQSFPLAASPVLPRRSYGDQPETVEVQNADGAFEAWTEVEQFADSSPTDCHFLVDSLAGVAHFGPRLREPGGEERQYGRVPLKGRAIRFTRYRSGGGAVGNVGRGTIIVPKSATDLTYVKWVSNLRPATGGRDRESLDQYKIRGPKLVRTREVAVTRADFEYLAREATPQAARIRCLAAGPNPSANGASPPRVRLLIVPAVPTTGEEVPRDQLVLSSEVRRELVRKVQDYLEERCPVTTELAVGLADYRWVSVRAKLVVRARKDREAVEQEAFRSQVQQDASRALYQFIQPVTGGPEGSGWPFGKSLTMGDVYPILQGISGVEYVEEVAFRAVTFDANGAAQLGADERRIRLEETEVLCSHDHDVDVVEE